MSSHEKTNLSASVIVIIMNKTLNNLYIKTTKEDTYPDKYNQTKPAETI
jgi:hypothetical protein